MARIGCNDVMCRRTVFTRASRTLEAKSDIGGKKFDSLKALREARSTPRMSSDISVRRLHLHCDMRCMLTRAVRSIGVCLSWQRWHLKLNLCLSRAGRSTVVSIFDKQLSSCAVGVDRDVGSGFSARLMGWRLAYPLTESREPSVLSRIIIIDFVNEILMWAEGNT
jgi:hypothetical protein